MCHPAGPWPCWWKGPQQTSFFQQNLPGLTVQASCEPTVCSLAHAQPRVTALSAGHFEFLTASGCSFE